MLTNPAGTNDLTRTIIGCGIRVHKAIGPGVFEHVYSECMAYEMRELGLQVEAGRAVPIVYKGVALRTRYYVDFVVEERVIVELKAVAALAENHTRQILTHLVLTSLPVGLLMNFNVVTLTDGGIKRVINPKMGALTRRSGEGGVGGVVGGDGGGGGGGGGGEDGGGGENGF